MNTHPNASPRRMLASTVLITSMTLLPVSLVGATAASATSAEPPAPPAVHYSAAVASDGTLLGGSHVLSTSRIAPGRYVVTFDSFVSPCAYIGTVTDDDAPVAVVEVARRKDDIDSVDVQTRTADGQVDRGFSLDVRCPTKTELWMVINADGSVGRRGADPLDVNHYATGRYDISEWGHSFGECAYTASIGSTHYTPVGVTAHVSTAFGGGDSGGQSHILVQTTDANGKRADMPFHLAVTCGNSKDRPWGVLDNTGTAVRGTNVLATDPVAPGVTDVTMRKTGGPCTYTATIGSAGTKFVRYAGEADVALVSESPNQAVVEVRTRLLDGTLQTLPVHLVLVCQ